jgi:glycosyltransferase involved in cell wall biosynthesis
LNDDRILYEKNEKNLGAILNVFEVLKRADGEYCLSLTDDDYLLPGALRAISNFITGHHPAAFKTHIVTHLEKTNKMHSYSPFNENIYPHNINYDQAAQLFLFSHVLTGLVLRKDDLDMEYLQQYGKDNWYPSMLAIGLMGMNIGYLAAPVAVHTWENETFWGIDPSETDILVKGQENIVLALKEKLEFDHWYKIVKYFVANQPRSQLAYLLSVIENKKH